MMRVLIVDDDPAICTMLKTVLSSKGHTVDTYLDPTETPLYRQREGGIAEVDAMLVDYCMPQMNGLDFLRRLKEQGCGPPEKNRALLTAYSSESLRREVDQLGVHFLKKPFRLPEISHWLDECSARLGQPAQGATADNCRR